MNKKILFFSMGAAVLLVLSFFPSVVSGIQIEDEKIEMETNEATEVSEESEITKIKVYHIKDDKTYTEEIKELPTEEAEALWGKFRSIDIEGLTLVEVFEKRLDLMKEYNLVPQEMTLSEIIDIDKLGDRYTTVNGEDFEVAFAPITFVGGGLGIGFGVPFFFTSGTFLWALFGFGLVLCYDATNAILYQLMTFFFIPMLIGYLGGFTGLMLLPVVPGFFYSNALGLGMAAIAAWKLLPAIE